MGGIAKNIKGYWDEDNILEKLKEANTPNLASIENKIILNAMFASDEDLTAFVNRIVKEFSRPKKSIAVN